MNGNIEILDSIKEELTQVRQKVLIAEEQTRILAGAAIEGIAIHDNGSLLFANQAFYNMFRYKENDIVGKNIITEVKAIDVASVADVQKSIESSNEIPYIVICVRSDGTRFRSVVTGRAMIYQDKVVRASIFLPLNDV